MKNNKQVRLTADLPLEVHTKLKTVAALSNKSMRDVLVELINDHLDMKDVKKLLKE